MKTAAQVNKAERPREARAECPRPSAPREWLSRRWSLLRSFGPAESSGVAVLLVSLAVLCGLGLPPMLDPNYALLREHLGGEALNVAEALLDGRGFSDPFGEPTGPTAWVPPVYPLLLATLLAVGGDRWSAGLTVQGLSVAVMVWVVWSGFRMVRLHLQTLSPAVYVALALLWVAGFRYWFFELTTDVWLATALTNLVILTLHSQLRSGRTRWVHNGALTALCALTSPALGTATGATMLWLYVSRRSWKDLLKLSAVVTLVVAPWVARNFLVFGKFIPVKSNLGFETYQANVVDLDGVYDAGTNAKHPFCSPELRFAYAVAGETRFIEERSKVFRRLLSSTPQALLGKIGNRATAALLSPKVANPGEDGPELALRSITYPTPIVGAALVLAPGRPRQSVAIMLTLFCAAHLLPYILIAFYLRYALAITPALVALAVIGADRGASWMAGNK